MFTHLDHGLATHNAIDFMQRHDITQTSLKKPGDNYHGAAAKGRKAVISLAARINRENFDFVVVIGGCATREVDYGFLDCPVVYISPALSTADMEA